jgi:hypothetical protein
VQIQDYFDTKTGDKLNESSLGRIYQHIQKKNVKSWSILSSYRTENSPSKNVKDFKQLKHKIKSLDLGFIQLEGYGQETDYSGDIVQVREPSLFIPDITQKQTQKLSDTYDQWGYIYSGPETNDQIVLFSKEGSEQIGSFHPNKIAKFFSKIKGKPFVFESVKPTSHMEAYWKHLKTKE